MRGDDLALERVSRHISRITRAQCLGKVARQRRFDPRIVGQLGCEEFVVEPNLAVSEQNRALGVGQAAALSAAFGDFIVAGQKLQRAVQATELFQVLDKTLLRIEELGRDPARNRQRLRLKVIVAEHQRGNVVGHFRQ